MKLSYYVNVTQLLVLQEDQLKIRTTINQKKNTACRSLFI